jgi:sensor histidine kinase YesM
MRRTVVTFLHFGYWLLYLLLLTVIFLVANAQIRKTVSLSAVSTLLILCIVPNLPAFYSFYFFLFDRFLQPKKWLGLIISGFFICLISSLLATTISAVIFGFEQPVFSNPNELLSLSLSLFFIAAIHSIIALIIRGFITWFNEINLKKELLQRTYETEIALVKSQINPHFLFNTINNIDVLITKDATKASHYLNRLSDILRYMVYDTKSEKISLQKELDYIEKYIELQKIRTTNPNYVILSIEGEPKNLQIAPMLFFPFIENAFKHTENNKKTNSININFSINETSIDFECKNTYQKVFPENENYGGLGNELIQKRLELLYPNKHTLEISDYDGIYKANLTICEN